VDLDDVLFPLLPIWVKAINDMYGTNVSEDNITGWDITEFFPTLTKEQIYAPLLYNGFWRSWQASEEGIWFVTKILEDGHSLKIVTSSFCQTLPVKMKKFFDYFPMLKWSDVTVTSDKQSIKGDVLVDDGFHNLIGGDYHKILIDKPHNRNCKTRENGITRVKSLTEAYEEICRLSEEID
jgi:5'(3')-deoxyribonucleotidase